MKSFIVLYRTQNIVYIEFKKRSPENLTNNHKIFQWNHFHYNPV